MDFRPDSFDISSCQKQHEGMKNSAPRWGFGSASRHQARNVFISESHTQDIKGKHSPGPVRFWCLSWNLGLYMACWWWGWQVTDDKNVLCTRGKKYKSPSPQVHELNKNTQNTLPPQVYELNKNTPGPKWKFATAPRASMALNKYPAGSNDLLDIPQPESTAYKWGEFLIYHRRVQLNMGNLRLGKFKSCSVVWASQNHSRILIFLQIKNTQARNPKSPTH